MVEPDHVAQVSMVIVRADQDVQLCEGYPNEYGMDEANVYVTFVYSRLYVTVWTAGELEPYQRRVISHQLLEYIKGKSLIM